MPVSTIHPPGAGEARSGVRARVPSETRPAGSCPSCQGSATYVFYEVRDVPVHSVLLMATRQAALDYPRGHIDLAACRSCGFIFNAAFNPHLHEYSERYEETQAFSDTFSSFQDGLAQRLVEKYSLYDTTVIEIGCGKGEFLARLCELGRNQGIGFDPSYRDDRNTSPAKDRITVIPDFYSEKYAGYRAAFICCKMTLEHIQAVGDFIATLRRCIGDRPETVVFFLVPNATRIFQDLAFWDIYYEHCSYFSPVSLCRLFRSCGFEILQIGKTYSAQYLTLEARPAQGVTGPTLPLEENGLALEREIGGFRAKVMKEISAWASRLEFAGEDFRMVLWGGGSKGVAFLTTLNVQDEIGLVVDINPYRHGTYMAGTGHIIVGPAALNGHRPDCVVLMNPIYLEEVERELMRMGLTPLICTV